MTIPISLNTISNLQDTTTAQTNINANSAAITGGFSTALNVIGDQMKGNLDMNSNQILNLPAPATANSPARLVDIISASTAITVPPVGTSGAVVPLLNANNTWSGAQTYSATSVFNGVSNFTGSVALTGAVTLNNKVSYYVNAATGNDSNLGTSASSPFLTIQGSVNTIQKHLTAPLNSATLNIAAGTYTESVTYYGSSLGIIDLVFQGASSASVTWAAPNGGNCLAVKDGAIATVAGITFSGPSSPNVALVVNQMGVLDVGSDVIFGTFSGGVHLAASAGGSINVTNNFTIAGNAAAHIQASNNGHVQYGSNVVGTISTSLTFSQYFFDVYYNGTIVLNNLTFTGAGATTCTGTKFSVVNGGCIASAGTDLNTLLPGSVSGEYLITGGCDAVVVNTISSPNITSPVIVNASLTSAVFSNPPVKPVYATVTALPSGVSGFIAIVKDATATTFMSTVTGGSTLTVPVFYDGTNWRIG